MYRPPGKANNKISDKYFKLDDDYSRCFRKQVGKTCPLLIFALLLLSSDRMLEILQQTR